MSRIKARSDLYEMDLVLDINVDIYPVKQGERLSVCLSMTLNEDGSPMPTGNPGQQVFDTVSKEQREREREQDLQIPISCSTIGV